MSWKGIAVFCVIFVVFAFVIYELFFNKKEGFLIENKIYKGLVCFDLDDTLTNATFKEIEECLEYLTKENYKIGIITASRRKIDHVCLENKSNVHWCPNKLCEILNNDNFENFNSLSVTSGIDHEIEIPIFKTYDESSSFFGMRKAIQMMGCKNKYKINESQCHLFDDQPLVLKWAKTIMPKAHYHLVDNNTPDKKISVEYLIKVGL